MFALFGMAVGLYFAVRGYKMAGASRLRFYQHADSVQAVGMAAWFTLMDMPGLAEQVGLGGNRHFVLLIAVALLSTYILVKGKAAAKKEEPKRWEQWEQALRAMEPGDRFLMRYPRVR